MKVVFKGMPVEQQEAMRKALMGAYNVNAPPGHPASPFPLSLSNHERRGTKMWDRRETEREGYLKQRAREVEESIRQATEERTIGPFVFKAGVPVEVPDTHPIAHKLKHLCTGGQFELVTEVVAPVLAPSEAEAFEAELAAEMAAEEVKKKGKK